MRNISLSVFKSAGLVLLPALQPITLELGEQKSRQLAGIPGNSLIDCGLHHFEVIDLALIALDSES
jgi:hypothetical protein